MHSILALAQFEQGCFLSHLTFRLLHVMQERGFGAIGLPFCFMRSSAFALDMGSSDMAAHVWETCGDLARTFSEASGRDLPKASSLLTERQCNKCEGPWPGTLSVVGSLRRSTSAR